MLLDKQALLEFQELYYKEFQIRLSETEANDYGIRLIGLVKAVYGNDVPKYTIDREGGLKDD